MKWFHLAFGLAVFIAFVVTGRFMRVDFPDKDVIPQELRLLMRSRHIYILFSAIIHLALGVYFQLRPNWLQEILQVAGSAALIVSSVLLVIAWREETYDLQHFSDLSRNGIYAALWGIGLHLVGGISLPSSISGYRTVNSQKSDPGASE